jgi:2,3-bisphosphoglycerate-independent phosphoglycerate mutase
MDLRALATDNGSKILLVVMDGLGGLADAEHGTELEEASTPNLDRLAAEGATGLLEPVGPGITPGSGPGHLALFGYDPMEFELGRGALSAAGLGFDLQPGDVAARGNLASLDADGRVTDRRAGRIPDDEAGEVVDRLQRDVHVEGVEVFFRPEAQHRVLVVLRGAGLDPRVTDTDPQSTGIQPLEPAAMDPAAERTLEVVRSLDSEVRRVLSGHEKAHVLLLRGFDSLRDLPSFRSRTGMRAAAVAVYPMYRGISKILGFDVLGPPSGLEEQARLLEQRWDDFDFFFVHHKATDSAGEDGNRGAKIAAIEQLDAALPSLLARGPDVVAVTGDHATPTQMAAHSWHPVPALVHGPRVGRDEVERFGETWCRSGSLGLRPSKTLLPILMANAGRLAKFGA